MYNIEGVLYIVCIYRIGLDALWGLNKYIVI